MAAPVNVKAQNSQDLINLGDFDPILSENIDKSSSSDDDGLPVSNHCDLNLV